MCMQLGGSQEMIALTLGVFDLHTWKYGFKTFGLHGFVPYSLVSLATPYFHW